MANISQIQPSPPGIAPGASAPALSLSAYSAFYASTPQAFDLKAPHLPEGDYAVVIVDALRATTTWVAMAAAGAEAIQIVVKDYSAMSSAQEASLGSPQWLMGGEKDGKPMPGGVIGNSPTEALPGLLAGKSVRFASTNGARAVKAASRFSEHVFLTCLTNIGPTCDAIAALGLNRIVFVAGGFYGAATLEDTVVVGRMLHRLIDVGMLTTDCLDDEARMAVAVAKVYCDDTQLVESLKASQVGRLLARIGRGDDVDAVVVGTGIAPQVWRNMHEIVLKYVPDTGFFCPTKRRCVTQSLYASKWHQDTGGSLYVGAL